MRSDSHDDLHVVLHEDDGQGVREAPDELRRLPRFLGAHPRGGLVEQQQLGIGGEGDPDLEIALLAVGEGAGQVMALVRQTDALHDVLGLVEKLPVARQRRPHVERRLA
jgi:hypothetical protein